MKPEISIPVALATGAVVVGTFAAMSPSMADVKTVPPGSRGDDFLAGAGSQAFYVAVGVSAAISLIARDPVPFWVGGGLSVAFVWLHRYNRQIDPMTGRLAGLTAGTGRLQGARYEVQAAG